MAHALFHRLSSFALATAAQHAPQAATEVDATHTIDTAAWQSTPERAGSLIYRGATFDPKAPGNTPLFRYERRVLPTPHGLVATHLTRTPAEQMVHTESGWLSTRYELQRLEVHNLQEDWQASASVGADGRHVHYRRVRKGRVRTAVETLSAPAVTGTSLFGFILQRWDALVAGATVPVRMVVPSEMDSYGFEIRLERHTAEGVRFTVTPSHFLIRLAVAPLRVSFDPQRQPMRYEGRVPPKQPVRGKLRDLDARVEYTPVAVAYR